MIGMKCNSPLLVSRMTKSRRKSKSPSLQEYLQLKPYKFYIVVSELKGQSNGLIVLSVYFLVQVV